MYGDDFAFEHDITQVVFSKARGVSALGRALPGLCLSSTCAKSYCIHKDPVTDGAQPFSQKALTYESPLVEASDLEWPEWSRWLNPPSRWSRRHFSDRSLSEVSLSDRSLSEASISSTHTGRYDFSTSLSSNTSLSSTETPTHVLGYEDKLEVSRKAVPGQAVEINSKTRNVPYNINNCLHPAKTGHTLWVGNLPHNATLQDLCDLFGTPKLQSIYLIQRTGCSFVNYSDNEGLQEAMRLVGARGPKIRDNNIVIREQASGSECTESTEGVSAATGSRNRYFICKSLTVADLEEAKRTGLWSTQIRNLEKFNEAFNTSENTYLVFSVNRMSCFYGVARLNSRFFEASTANVSAKEDKNMTALVTPTDEYMHAVDGLLIPAGQTVYDPLRGSQFWMAHDCPVVEPEVEKFTAPARITWITAADSTVAFSKTKSWKNKLNQNKPLKVARDGTEIEPGVARELCNLFSRA